MATRVACFSFSDEEKYELARKNLYDNLYQDYQNNSKIYFYGKYGDEYVLYIYDECSNLELACKYCIASGGDRKSANYGY